jgi:hypothetical protein
MVGALLLRRDRRRAFGLLHTSALIELLAGQTFNSAQARGEWLIWRL